VLFVLLPIIWKCYRLIHEELKTKNENLCFVNIENYAEQLEILPPENI
jgi:hypothetical protein